MTSQDDKQGASNTFSDAMEEQFEPETPQLTAVSIKLPPLWPAAAETWFSKADSQFRHKGVTSSLTKFDHVVSTFDQPLAIQFADIINAPPTFQPYEALKARVLRQFGLTDFQRFEAVININYSHDEKPSVLMNNLLALMPAGYKPDFMFIGHFLRRMPQEIRVLLLRHVDSEPRELAAVADELWQIRSAAPVNSFSYQEEDQFQDLNVLRNTSSSANRQSQNNSNTRRHLNKSSHSTQSNSQQSNEVCWYHETFGSSAQTCRKPCSFSGNGKPGRRN